MLAVPFIKVGELVALQFVYGLLQDLLVGLVAEIGDKAALFGTQHIARASDIEILHGDVNATAQLGEVLDGLQSSASLLRESRQRR